MSRYLEKLAVVGIYALLAVIMTWPVAGNFTTHVAGEGGDPWQTMWRFTVKAEGGFQEFASDLIGAGEPQLVNLSVWPWMPIHVIFGQPVGYNLVWLFAIVLSGLSMYVLVQALAAEQKGYEFPPLSIHAAALIAGVAYMFLPYRIAHSYGHFGAMQTHWLPFIITLGIYWWRKPTLGKSLLLSALLVMQAWTEHHYMLWLAMFIALVIVLWWRKIRLELPQKKIWVAVVGVVSAVFIIMPYMPTIQLAVQPDSSIELGKEQLIRFSADLFAFITPAPFHPLWGGVAASQFANQFTGNVSESTQYLGISILLLILFFGQGVERRMKRFWVTVLAVFFLVALGPRLHVIGNVLSFPLPYELIDSWPILSAVRAVGRAGVFVGLSMTVLLGLVLSNQLKRKVSAIALVLVVLFEFLLWPAPSQSAALPQAYQRLAAMEGKSVIEIPAATNYSIASRALYGSTIHDKKVLGNIALERAFTEGELELIKRLPAVRQLLYLRTTELREDRTEFFNQSLPQTLVETMDWVDAHAILVHPDSLSTLQWQTVKRFLEEDVRLTPQYIDDVVLYELNGNKPVGDDVFLLRGEGFSNIGFDEKRDAVFAQVEEVAQVMLINTSNEQRRVLLEFEYAPETEGGVAVLAQNGQIIEGEFEIPPGQTTVSLVQSGPGVAILMNPNLVVVNQAQ